MRMYLNKTIRCCKMEAFPPGRIYLEVLISPETGRIHGNVLNSVPKELDREAQILFSSGADKIIYKGMIYKKDRENGDPALKEDGDYKRRLVYVAENNAIWANRSY